MAILQGAILPPQRGTVHGRSSTSLGAVHEFLRYQIRERRTGDVWTRGQATEVLVRDDAAQWS